MVATYIRSLMEERGVSAVKLSEASGVPVTTINRLISGQTENPTIQNCADLVTALNGSLDEMMGIHTSSSDDKHGVHIYTASWETGMAYRAIIANKDKWITRLFVCLAAMISLILLVLFIDILHPDLGWIQQLFDSHALKITLPI